MDVIRYGWDIMSIDIKSPGFIVFVFILLNTIIISLMPVSSFQTDIIKELEQIKKDVDERINNDELIQKDVYEKNNILMCTCYFQPISENESDLDEEPVSSSIELEKIANEYNDISLLELATNNSYRLVSIYYFNEVGVVYKKEYYHIGGQLFAKCYIYCYNEITKYYDRDGNFIDEVIIPIIPVLGCITG